MALFTNHNLVYEVMKYLDYPTIVNLYSSNSAIYSTCRSSSLIRSIILQRYTDDIIIRSHDSLPVAFKFAVKEGNLSLVNELLRRGVDPSDKYIDAVVMASRYGHPHVLNRLLQDQRVDPSIWDNLAIVEASTNGHSDVVNRLLQDPKVNPGVRDNIAIALASENGHLDIINRLLQDPRVNPGARNNLALIGASMNGHLSVINRLLQDRRVDPNARGGLAIKIAYRHPYVVNRLIQDGLVSLKYI